MTTKTKTIYLEDRIVAPGYKADCFALNSEPWPLTSKFTPCHLSWWSQMPIQELKSTLSVDRVRSVEDFHIGAVGEAELDVLPARLGVFVGHPFI